MNPAPTRRLASRILFMAVLFSSATAAGGDGPPWDRRVSLDIWGGSLSDAIREIRIQAGVEMVIYPPDLPAVETGGNLWLISDQAGLAAVLECLARRYAFRYRLSPSGRVELSRGYDWVGGDSALIFPGLEALVPPEGMDPAAMEETLREFVKVVPLLPGNPAFAMESSPAPGHPMALRMVASLPPVPAAYLEKAILCLAGDDGYLGLAEGGVRGEAMAAARQYGSDWRGLLERRTELRSERDPRRLLAGLAAGTGLAFILSAPPTAAGSDPPSGRMTLGQATAGLSAWLGLGKRVFLSAGAVLFEPSAREGDWETDDLAREFFWTGLAVGGLDARRAALAAGGGKALAARLRLEVFPSVWRDPICGLAYSPVTGRLALVAPANVVMAAAKKTAEWSR